MAKMPRYSYNSFPDLGCGSTTIMLILLGLCPPLAFIYLLIYAFFEDNFKNYKWIYNTNFNIISNKQQ